MPVGSPVSRLRRTIAYWVRLCLLTLFGPATLDAEHDPIVQLKREHERQQALEREPADSPSRAANE